MAINSLIDHIANHGTDGSVTVGANTPAPYASANLTGFVDGTGPQNASKNMAEFYNRQVFAAKHLIEAAGLTWDQANWAQMTQAVIALGGGLHGGSCVVTGPTAPPSTATPYTKYTSVAPYLEDWEWSPVNGWQVVSNQYSIPEKVLSSGVLAPGNNLVGSFIAPRSGHIFLYARTAIPAGGANTVTVLAGVAPILFEGSRSVYSSGVEPISSIGCVVDVVQDDVVGIYSYPALSGSPAHSTFYKYNYIK